MILGNSCLLLLSLNCSKIGFWKNRFSIIYNWWCFLVERVYLDSLSNCIYSLSCPLFTCICMSQQNEPSPDWTNSPKGNDHSPESNVPWSNLISKKKKKNGPWKPEARNRIVRAFMPVLVTSNFDDDLIKNEWVSMETPFSHYKSMGNFLHLKGS